MDTGSMYDDECCIMNDARMSDASMTHTGSMCHDVRPGYTQQHVLAQQHLHCNSADVCIKTSVTTCLRPQD